MHAVKELSQFYGMQKCERLLGYNLRCGFCPKEITFLMNAILLSYLSVKLRECTSFRNVPEFLPIWWIYFNYAMILASTGVLQSYLLLLSTSVSNPAAPINKLTWMK